MKCNSTGLFLLTIIILVYLLVCTFAQNINIDTDTLIALITIRTTSRLVLFHQSMYRYLYYHLNILNNSITVCSKKC